MSSTAAVFGSIRITWSGLTVAFGILAGVLLAYSLYTAHSGRGKAIWLVLCFSVIPSVLASRIVYVVFHGVEYSGFFAGLLDYSDGGFWLPGAVITLWPAALLIKKTALPDEPEELLDALAPGTAFFAGMVRLSAVFGNTCRSMYVVSAPAFRHFPVAVKMLSADGQTVWHFATFYVSALLLFALMIASLTFYILHHADKMKKPCTRHGNVARLTLVLFCAVELVLDSTRADRTVLSFHLLRFLNHQMREVSITQIFCTVMMLLCMLYYSKCTGSKGKKRLSVRWLLFGGGFLCAMTTEVLVQRYTEYALLLTLAQALSALAMAAGIFLGYLACRDRENYSS